MKQSSFFVLITLILAGGLALTWGCSTESVVPTATSATPSSPQEMNMGGELALNNYEEFSCANVEKVRVRFSEPGYVDGSTVGLYVEYVGVVAGRKKLRIWWDYENDPTHYKDVDVGEGEVQRNDDTLSDIEKIIEHTYTGLTQPTELKVRVELIVRGRSGGCVRVRQITVGTDTAAGGTSGAPSPAAYVLKSQNASWGTAATLRANEFAGPNVAVGPPFYLPAGAAPSIAELKDFCISLGLRFNLTPSGPVETWFPDVVNGWDPPAFMNLTTLGIGPSAVPLNINNAAVQAAMNAKLADLSLFDLRIYRIRAGVETLILSRNLADAEILVQSTLTGGVRFIYQWNLDSPLDLTLIAPTDLIRYEIHARP